MQSAKEPFCSMHYVKQSAWCLWWSRLGTVGHSATGRDSKSMVCRKHTHSFADCRCCAGVVKHFAKRPDSSREINCQHILREIASQESRFLNDRVRNPDHLGRASKPEASDLTKTPPALPRYLSATHHVSGQPGAWKLSFRSQQRTYAKTIELTCFRLRAQLRKLQDGQQMPRHAPFS